MKLPHTSVESTIRAVTDIHYIRTILATLLAVGCADNAGASYSPPDAGIDSNADTAIAAQPCWLEVESVEGGPETGWITRNNSTFFRLVPRSDSCNDQLATGTPDEVAGRQVYHRPAQVCIYQNRIEQCANTDFAYMPGGSVDGGGAFKSVYSIGPVNFSTFPGVPADWNDVNYPISLVIRNRPEDIQVAARVNFDWTTPQVSSFNAVRVTAETVDFSFNSDEPGIWGIDISGENIGGTEFISCSGEHKINTCSSDQFCIIQERGFRCVSQPWGGRINRSGLQRVSIPFSNNVGTSHAATLTFSDLAGNRTSARTTVSR